MKDFSTNILYVDAANLIMSSKNFVDGYNVVDLLIHLQEKYHIQKCVYFTSRFLDFKQEYSSLEQIGVEIVYKEKYIENSKLKANCDVEISHRMTFDLNNLSKRKGPTDRSVRRLFDNSNISKL